MSGEDDDWFEQAVEDAGSHEDASGESDVGDSATDDTAADFSATDDATGEGSSGDRRATTDAGPSPDDDHPSPDDGEATDATEGGAFDTEGAGAFGGGESGDPGGDPVDASGDGPFEEDFASAFESGGGETEFDDEDLETDIPRVDLGIEGLDDMIQGGIPERHLMTAIGSAGTGKTTFGLQFLHHGLQQGDDAVFITLEQSHESILDTASEWGWDFEGYEADERLAVVDLDPVEMANSLDNIRGELPELIEDFGADRLVLDSVSLLEMMYDNPAQRRTEVYDFTRSLKNAGVTTFLTSEASEANPYASRHGIIEYLTDAVFVLQYVRSESRETRLAIEIVKIRNANHSRATKPYELTNEGISVYQQANIF